MSIKIANVEVMGWEAAIRGARNPMNSWAKSDSCFGENCSQHYCSVICDSATCEGYVDSKGFTIGPNDLDLMKRLCKAGTDHRKFMRMITVYMDITAPFYLWKEISTYKVGTVTNSCSTMHKIHAKEFTLEDFSCEHLLVGSLNNLRETISLLNQYRYIYNHYDSIKNGEMIVSKEIKEIIDILTKKQIWWQMIQLLPSSYNQKRTVMLNYEVLANMYHSRKNHKLDDWREFCEFIETLPYSELITGQGSEEERGMN